MNEDLLKSDQDGRRIGSTGRDDDGKSLPR